MDGNEIKISFYNDGQISGLNIGNDVRGIWKGYEYISDIIPLIGLELPLNDYTNDEKIDTIHSVIISRGPRKGQYEERHPTLNYFWGFNPLSNYMSDNPISPAMSNKPSTWPLIWADHPEWGENVWNGINGANEFSGDLETYFVMDDYWDDEFNEKYGFYPDTNNTNIKGHGIQVSVRYIQSNNPLYENTLFRIYDITNKSKHTYNKMFWGNITGTLLGGDGDSHDDLTEYNIEDNIIYSWDSDYSGNEKQKVGVIGEAIIYGPNQGDLEGFEYFELSSSPDLSNDEELWSRCNKIEILNVQPQDGDHLYACSTFSLIPNQTRRIVTVLTMGFSKNEVHQSILHARSLWNSNFDFDLVHSIVQITNLTDYRALSGIENIEWTSQVTGGTCDIYFSNDTGISWSLIASDIPNIENFTLKTNDLDDCYFGKIKIFLKDQEGDILGYDESAYFSINNSFNGLPQIFVDEAPFEEENLVVNNNIRLKILAGDAESDIMELITYYSYNDGISFDSIYLTYINSNLNYQELNLNLEYFLNSERAKIKIQLSDGTNDIFYISPSFIKETQREKVQNDKYIHLAGFAEYPFTINIIDETKLTGDEYLISFDDTSSIGNIFMNVFSITKNYNVLNRSRLIVGNESEIFDGLSFKSEKFCSEIDEDNTGWVLNNNKDISVQVKRFQSNMIEGLILPFNYEIVFYNELVDTTLADTIYTSTGSNIFPAKGTSLKVKNLMTNENIAFVQYDYTGTYSTVKYIWFKEKIGKKYFRTLQVIFTIPEQNYNITSGNNYSIITKKGFSFLDTIKVFSLPVSVKNIGNNYLPNEFYLSQNYPNPFNPTTIIEYSIPSNVKSETSNVASDFSPSQTTLIIYNVLGQKVNTLVNEHQSPGYYSVTFDASNLASGIYYYQLKFGSLVQTKKMILLR